MELFAHHASSEKRVSDLVESLSREALNKALTPHSWSVLECVDHLNAAYEEYKRCVFERLEEPMSLWVKTCPYAKALGRFLVKEMGPHNAKRFKSPRNFQPTRTGDLDPQEVLQNFKSHHQYLEEKEPYFLSKINENYRVVSPAGKLFVFPLKDAIALGREHELRHLNQAERVARNLIETIHASD